MATADKLITVAENVPKVYHAGQLNIVKNAECLKNNKSGSAMLLDDVSPVTHEMGVKVRGKNLFDVNNQNWSVGLISAINGTLNASNTNYKTTDYISILEPNKAYTVGFNQTFETSASTSNRLCFYDENKNFIEPSYNGNYTEVKRYSYQLNVPANAVYIRYSVRITDTDIQLELGTTATDYTPYVPDLTAVKVSRCGKNIFDISKYIDNEKLFYDEKSHTATFKEDTERIQVSRLFTFLPNINYVISVNNITDNVYIGGQLLNGNFTWLTKDHNHLKVSFSETSNISIYIVKIKTSEVTTESFNGLQFELGSTATEYEPYITPIEYTPNADGTVNGVISLYPNTTLTTYTDGVLIDCEYYKDIDKTFNELTTSVALSGGNS